MIKIKHKFHDSTSESGNGQDYLVGNKMNGAIMAVSCGDLSDEPAATAATITFYGKGTGSKQYIPIQAIKASDLTLSSTGSINEVYLIDLTSYEGIRVALSGVAGGTVTVIGEVVE